MALKTNELFCANCQGKDRRCADHDRLKNLSVEVIEILCRLRRLGTSVHHGPVRPPSHSASAHLISTSIRVDRLLWGQRVTETDFQRQSKKSSTVISRLFSAQNLLMNFESRCTMNYSQTRRRHDDNSWFDQRSARNLPLPWNYCFCLSVAIKEVLLITDWQKVTR